MTKLSQEAVCCQLNIYPLHKHSVRILAVLVLWSVSAHWVTDRKHGSNRKTGCQVCKYMYQSLAGVTAETLFKQVAQWVSELKQTSQSSCANTG